MTGFVISVCDDATMNTSLESANEKTKSSIPPVSRSGAKVNILNLPLVCLITASVGLPSSFSVAPDIICCRIDFESVHMAWDAEVLQHVAGADIVFDHAAGSAFAGRVHTIAVTDPVRPVGRYS